MLLSRVFIPALQEQTNWGTLSSDANGHVLKEAFMGKLSSFVSILSNARASIADAVELSPCKHPGLAGLSSPPEILAAAGNPELVEAAEAITNTWCKEIELVSGSLRIKHYLSLVFCIHSLSPHLPSPSFPPSPSFYPFHLPPSLIVPRS